MIHLEKFTENEFEKLISWIDTKEALMQFGGPKLTFPLTKEQLQETLTNKNVFAFNVVDSATNSSIGHAEIFLKDSSFALGRILIGEKEMRGKGLGKIVVDKLLEFGFHNFNKNFAELNVFDWNTSAIKCYEKGGFEVNPNIKLERKINNETWIAINMIIDKNKWQDIKIKKICT